MSNSSIQRRLEIVQSHLLPNKSNLKVENQIENEENASQTNNSKNTITVVDNRTGKSITIPIIHDEAIDANELKKLNIVSYDHGFMNTAVCESRITYIDGDKGILRYRGYNIEELAEKSSFMEVSFLLINGELPTKNQLNYWSNRIQRHTYLHENLIQLLKTFRYDAHPMGMVISSIAALSTFYPDANPALQGNDILKDETLRNKQIYRILGKMPTIAACAYRNRIGRPYNNPENDLGYTENFLYMLDHLNEKEYRPHPVLARALDILFILHADHELNCSTAAMKHISSSGVDPYSALAGAAGALYGPLHGGACQAVLQMLESIGSKENIPKFIEDVKNKKKMLMGFGHRIYKSYDPRARIVKRVADQVFALLGKEPLIEIAVALEQIALKDEYFISRKLYPNIDFYSGLIYKAMGFPTDMFPVLFAIPRTVGWLAHWVESLNDPASKIYRPRQIYLGSGERKFVDLDSRKEAAQRTMQSSVSVMTKRRDASEVNK